MLAQSPRTRILFSFAACRNTRSRCWRVRPAMAARHFSAAEATSSALEAFSRGIDTPRALRVHLSSSRGSIVGAAMLSVSVGVIGRASSPLLHIAQCWELWPAPRHEIGKAARGGDGKKGCRCGMPIKAGREALQATNYLTDFMLAVRQNVGEDYSIHPHSGTMIMFDFSYEKVGKNQDIVAVVLSGTLDENNCNYLLGCVENQILDRHTKLILDCGQVTFISSLGLGTLVRVNSRMKKIG